MILFRISYFSKLALSLFCVLVFISIISCHSSQNDDGGKSVFRYNEAAGITSLDPAFAKDQANIWAVNQLFNGLVQMSDILEVEPAIAKKWEIKDNGLKYIFHLRNDVFFHNDPVFVNGIGRKVTANDFAYSFGRIMNAEIASPGSWIFNHVRHQNPFEAANDSTIIIHLQSPFPPFLGLLSMQYCSVLPPEAIAKYGKDFRSHPVGTGPFKFKLWEEGVSMAMLKNENYFERQDGIRLPHLDAISISFISEKQSAFLQFLQGKLDFFSGIDASYKDQLLTSTGELQAKYKGKFNIDVQPYLNTEYLGILMDTSMAMVKSSPLRMKALRQAINYGFDRTKMIDYLRNGIGTPGIGGMIPPGLPSYDAEKVKGYHFNEAKAASLLQKAGFPNGKGLPIITLSTTPSYLDLCEYIQSELSNLGIKIKIEVNKAAPHREMVAKSKLNFFRGSWIADYPDAENYLALFYSKNFSPQGPNYTHFSNAHFDDLYELAMDETDSRTRHRYYQIMDQIITDEAPVVVLYYDKLIRLRQNNIHGLRTNAMNLLSLKRVKKD